MPTPLQRQESGNEGQTFARFAMGYKPDARPCKEAGALLRALACAALAFSLGACSLSLPMMSLQEEPETTASISARAPSRLDPSLDDEDWRRARAALSLAVDPQGPGVSVNWDNPLSKRRGSFAAAGDMKLVDDTICRPFSATLHQPAGKESKLSGEACRIGPGEWALRMDSAAAAKVPVKEALNQPLPLPLAPMQPAQGSGEKAK